MLSHDYKDSKLNTDFGTAVPKTKVPKATKIEVPAVIVKNVQNAQDDKPISFQVDSIPAANVPPVVAQGGQRRKSILRQPRKDGL